MILKAKNWGEFQHYKDRDPPWIKLHKRLLDDRNFHALPDASRALAPMLWLLCSESKEGTIKDAVAEISFRLRMTEKKVEDAVKPLIEAGFFYVEQDDSAVIAPCERDATQSQRQSKDREEAEERAFNQFCLEAQKRGWPEPAKLSSDRRKKLRARLDEHGEEGWQKMLDLAGASEFLTTKFPVKFDWIVEPRNFQKVIEGNYSQGRTVTEPRKPGEPVPFLGTAEPWEQRLRGYRPGATWWKETDWGPRPETGRCRAPKELVERYLGSAA